MTAVDELRRAATLIRERARAATAGPWAVERDDEDMFTYVQSVKLAGWQGQVADVHTPDASWPDFDHIASWHPAVALAVADWLEDEAIYINDVPYRVDADWIERNYRAALAVARTYLNGAAQ